MACFCLDFAPRSNEGLQPGCNVQRRTLTNRPSLRRSTAVCRQRGFPLYRLEEAWPRLLGLSVGSHWTRPARLGEDAYFFFFGAGAFFFGTGFLVLTTAGFPDWAGGYAPGG